MLEDHVKETIIEKLSEALKVNSNEIELEDSFADYGLDSIIGVHLVQVLNQASTLNWIRQASLITVR
ncbi:acyl carrier protein [Paenibacillus sp. JCM 10914]|uniref:acyl carrier protein n=1 Tax=Paenibacillus sp. JCM 10914 TaxID=1236974 RepID=UPI00351C84AE